MTTIDTATESTTKGIFSFLNFVHEQKGPDYITLRNFTDVVRAIGLKETNALLPLSVRNALNRIMPGEDPREVDNKFQTIIHGGNPTMRIERHDIEQALEDIMIFRDPQTSPKFLKQALSEAQQFLTAY